MTQFIFNPSQLLWVERYRPQTIDDCILPTRLKETLKKYAATGDFPSLLFAGSPGTGKTTAAKALCNERGMDTLVVNVSNERGIDVLRTQIASFATAVSLDGGLKCIILDEFDGATELLQKALRAAIEEYSINCRFILTCNYPNKIIEAIHSRTALIDMKIEKSEVPGICKDFLLRLETILKNENVEYERKALATLIQREFPDYRSIINQLQQLSALGKIDSESVVTGHQEISITKLIKIIGDRDFKAMRQWVASNANSDVNILFRKVYDEIDTIFDPGVRPEVVVILAQYMHYAVTAIDPEINIAACLTELMALSNK